MSKHLEEIQSIIDNRIGPAAALEFKVEDYSGTQLRLSAPLDKNLNHHGTAFGGSLFSLAAVCGWGFVLLKLRENDLHGLIVVKNSTVDYLLPVDGDLSVSCGAEQAEIDGFLAHYKEHGRARLVINGVAPNSQGKPALRLQSTYTVIAQ